MRQETADLVERLKEAGEDFEFYPTTKEMVRAIWKHATDAPDLCNHDAYWHLLDIGCGTCNFRRWIEELNAEERQKYDKDTLRNQHYKVREIHINEYCVIEKSSVLLERLDRETIVLGTDFHESTLIDKDCDTIFCNPPYSEFEEWTAKIIRESRARGIYLIIPERWRKSETIKQAIARLNAPARLDRDGKEEVVQVIGHADFHHAERNARAKVDILFINKEWTKQESGFDAMFDELFGMPDDNYNKYETDFKEAAERENKLKAELAAGKNKVEILCDGYNAARDELFRHFKTICDLDPDVLKSIGVHKEAVKEALKKKFYGLKNLYWESAFDCLEEITSRLTSKSREKMLDKFAALKTVDFTPSNLYAMIIWVIKNYNQYAEDQLIELFYALSSTENVRNYVSNKRVFEEYRSRWGQPRSTHYTLDYRIVCTTYALPDGDKYRDVPAATELQRMLARRIGDVCTVANNLGFPVGTLDVPRFHGEIGNALGKDGKKLFEFRAYKNRNIHIKFSIELMKALNVAAAQRLGWIRKPEDIKAEFTPEMADGAEKYFDRFNRCAIDINRAATLLLPA